MKAIKFFLFCICLLLTACGDKDEMENSLDYAPTSIIGKDLSLSRGSDMDNWYVKILQTRLGLQMITQDRELSNCSCEYEKTGKNQAKLKINYTINILDKQVRHAEELNILFTSEHGGIFRGKDNVTSDSGTYEQESSGYFAFDTGDLSDFDTGDVDVDFSYLCNSWKCITNSSDKYLTFYQNKTYLIVTNDNSYQEERGTYRINVATSCIYLTSEQGVTKQYLVDFLMLDKLEWRQYNQQTGKYSYEAYFYSDKDGAESDLGGENEPESDILYVGSVKITPDLISFIIKYKNPENYTSSNRYLKAGLCFGTSPHPTITKDRKTSVSIIDPDEDTSRSIFVDKSTVYYLRPYTEENGKVNYYKEIEIASWGKYIDANIESVGKNTVKANYAITNGLYKLSLSLWRTTGTQTLADIGYKGVGEGDYTYTFPLDFKTSDHIVLIFRDSETGCTYESARFYPVPR